MSTNGTRSITDVELPGSIDGDPQAFDTRSMDERLASLKETIHSWDWRTAPASPAPTPGESLLPPPPVAEVATPPRIDPLPPPPPVTEVATPPHIDPLPPPPPVTEVAITPRIDPPPPPPVTEVAASTGGHTASRVSAASSVLSVVGESPETTHPSDLHSGHATAATGSAVLDRPTPHVADATPPPSAPEATRASDEAAMAFGPEPKAEPEGSVRRLWSHPWAKAGVLGLAAVLGVVAIIWGIHHVAGTGSSQQSSTSTTTPASSVVHKGPPPISAADLIKFKGYASALQKANQTATRGFIGAGTTPTPAHVAAVIAPYHAALNLYYFQLHFIQWPASMSTATEIEYAQLQTLMSFLQSFSSVDPSAATNGMAAWISQLHNRTGTTQAADNQVRQDLGLPATSSFP